MNCMHIYKAKHQKALYYVALFQISVVLTDLMALLLRTINFNELNVLQAMANNIVHLSVHSMHSVTFYAMQIIYIA